MNDWTSRNCGHAAERRNRWGCKDCNAARQQAWRRANPERWREINRRSHVKNREQSRIADRAKYHADPDRFRAKARRDRAALKEQAYAAYGGYICRCCGETEPVFLCLDHINNDGAAHRKAVRPESLYAWLRRNGYPPIMQVLCHNCNNAKKYGECPHATQGRRSA